MTNDDRLKIMTFKDVDLVDITPASTELFKPFNGKTFIPTKIVVRTKKVTGTITTQPSFKITDGTNDIVAAAANANANQGRAKDLTVIVDREIGYAKPLTLTRTVAAAGTNPVFRVDIIVLGFFL